MRLLLRASFVLLASGVTLRPVMAQTVDPTLPTTPLTPVAPTGSPTPNPTPNVPVGPTSPGVAPPNVPIPAAPAPTSILLPPSASVPTDANAPAGGTSTQGSGERLSLRAAVTRAVARNPSATVAAAEAQRAEALEKQARAASWPTLIGTAIYTRLDDDRIVAGRVAAGKDQLSANLTLNVPLFAPRAWAAGTRAGDNTRVAQASAAEIRRQVAAATGRAYLAALTQLRAVEIGERARATAQAHLTYARTRLAGGAGNKLDEARAASEVAAAEAQVQGARLGLARAREALAVLLGSETPIDINGEADLESPPKETSPSAPASGDPNALPDGLSRRADVMLARERIRAADRATGQTWTEYAPSLSLIAQPFYQNPATLTLPLTGWQAQLVLSLPIYDGGLRSGVIAERHALAQSMRESARATVNQVRSEDRLARESIARAEASLAAAQESARLAGVSLELSSTSYQAGATNNLEVIDADRRARDAATMTILAEDALRQARLDWMIAAGKL